MSQSYSCTIKSMDESKSVLSAFKWRGRYNTFAFSHFFITWDADVNSIHVQSGSFWALVLIIIFKYKYTCTCIMTPRSGCCLLILTVCLRDPNLTMANVGAKSCFLLNVSPSKLCYWWTHWCRIYSYSQSWSAPTHYKHTQLQGNTTGYIIYAHLLK